MGLHVELNNRICPVYENGIEDAVHVIIHCPVYSNLRNAQFDKAAQINANFLYVDIVEKLIFCSPTQI